MFGRKLCLSVQQRLSSATSVTLYLIKFKSYYQMSVLFASMYTVNVQQPILLRTFFVLTVGFLNHNPSMQGVLYFFSLAHKADIPTGTWFWQILQDKDWPSIVC
jgi:hypothetical protein